LNTALTVVVMCGSVVRMGSVLPCVWLSFGSVMLCCVAGCANPSRKRECMVRFCGVCEERDGFGSVCCGFGSVCYDACVLLFM